MLPQASYWKYFDRNGNVANCLIGGCKKPAVSIAKQQSQGEAENRQYRVGENLKAIKLFRNNIPFYLWGRGCGVKKKIERRWCIAYGAIRWFISSGYIWEGYKKSKKKVDLHPILDWGCSLHDILKVHLFF